jgi:hypothetical protein
MKWCERCGGPVRGDVLYTDHGCRLCWLERQAAWWPKRNEPWPGLPAEGEANSPCPHASGWWLPEGAREALLDRIVWHRPQTDADRLECWLQQATYEDPTGWIDGLARGDDNALDLWHRMRHWE